ncbi:hypothetical protein BDW62DRAFT_219246 [Aspergillus aurantiobrunneus]
MQEQTRPILTSDEIRHAKDICPYRTSGRKHLENSESTVLKVGYEESMGEAEAMCLVRRPTPVPVPKVLNAYMIDDIGFILMEKVPGVSLAQGRGHLSERSRQSVIRQLKSFIHQWRNVEADFFGSVDGGPCDQVIFKHPWRGQPDPYGPFQSRREVNEGVVLAHKRARPQGQLVDEEDHLLAKRILASGDHGQDERTIFTHGDLHASNIILDGDRIAGIVDWGASGHSIAATEPFGFMWTAEDESWKELASTILDSADYDFRFEVNYSMTTYTGIGVCT